MLPRSRRVSTPLFQEIVEKGKSYHSAHLSLRLLSTREPSRFTFSVPKKVDTRATKRNYIKRKGLALLRPHLDALPPGFAGIFFAKSGIATLPTVEYQQEITYLIEKISRLS